MGPEDCCKFRTLPKLQLPAPLCCFLSSVPWDWCEIPDIPELLLSLPIPVLHSHTYWRYTVVIDINGECWNFNSLSPVFILIRLVSLSSDAHCALALTLYIDFIRRSYLCSEECVWRMSAVNRFTIHGDVPGSPVWHLLFSKSMLIKKKVPFSFFFKVSFWALNLWEVYWESQGVLAHFRGVCWIKEHYRVDLHQLTCKSVQRKWAPIHIAFKTSLHDSCFKKKSWFFVA